MGYRSEIVIAVDPTVYANAPEEVKASFEEIFTRPVLEESERIIFNHNYVKWYDSDPAVAVVENWLQSLEEAEYGLIELGEDLSDVRMEGEYYTYDIGFVRKIEF